MMRIDRISLRDFRGVTWAEIVPAPTGVTVIEGDNEVGKTSIPEALDLLLTTRDDSKKSAVKAVQPVGRDVGPEVSADLTCGTHTFTYTKRWLRRPETTLHIHTPTPAQFTGREAHEKVEAILAEHVDMALWEALRIQQGEPTQAGFAATSLGRALDRASGGDHHGDQEDDLWTRIVDERARYWTATGLPVRTRVDLAERLEAAEADVAAIERELRQLDDHTDEVARLQADAAQLSEVRQQLTEEARTLEERADRVAELRRRVTQLEATRDAAQAHHEKWSNLAAARARLVADVTRLEEDLAGHRRALADGAPARERSGQDLTRATEAREGAAAALRTIEEAHTLAVADQEHRHAELELAQISERRDRVIEAEAKLRDAEAVLDSNRIGAQDITDLTDAHLAVVEARAAAASGAVSVDTEALSDLTLSIDGETVALAPGHHHRSDVLATTEITLPGVARLTVQAGTEAIALAERLTAAEEDLARRCAILGVTDLSQAQERAQQRLHAERDRREAQDRIRDDLRDLTLDVLSRKAQSLADRVAGYGAERPAEPPLPADFDAAKELARSLGDELRRARTAKDEADEAVRRAREADEAARVDVATRDAQVEMAAKNLAQAERNLAEARLTQTDDTLAAETAAAATRLDEAQRDLAHAADLLRAEDPDALDELVDNARGALAGIKANLATNRDRRRDLEAVLTNRGEEGLAQRRDQACTERDRLRAEKSRLEARAEAALLLHDTFARRRAEARSRYVAPFRERIESLGRIVFGPSLSVSLDEDLRIESRTLDDRTIAFDQLSTGAQEQLGIVARLAGALIVADDGGVPVLLDDALGWTDPGRLTQMGAAIGRAGRSCQVIVLTCTPGRYAGADVAVTTRLTSNAEPPAEEPERTSGIA